ncbi:beta-lactamase superfamily domain-containing protein [Apodospora peruviana]|uniref:Beta-lactamase superfamily domain-containing protein n=1 Tax=Apodospora peruviana TaxID=516989 RepID=A0AAE0M6W6_9PEZI|nr:beta-lactamase superfamily domain-containing protein [Apodospora peruviana]
MGVYEVLVGCCQRLLASFLFPQFTSSTPIMGSESYACTVAVKPGTVPDDAKAHHVKTKAGRPVLFGNPFPSYGWKGVSLLRAAFIFARYRLQGKLPVPDASDAKIPHVSPTFLPSRTKTDTLRATWIGHATCFVEFPSGFRALFDPVFEEKFNAASPRRFTPPACKPGDFPALDAVFISHDHHDHLSLPTVKELAHLYPRVHFFCGLNRAAWFREAGITAVTEMDWWDDAHVVLENPNKTTTDRPQDASGCDGPESISVRVSCLPSQHGCMRSPFDKDSALWASWAVSSGGKSVWFAGDTGYRNVPEGIDELGPGFDELPRNPQFTQIGQLRGPFDVGLIPIGAYHPRMMYSPVHASPLDAVEIFLDTRCQKAIGIHWGTWALTSEPVAEPPEKLKEALKAKGLPQAGLFDVCAIGESRIF